MIDEKKLLSDLDNEVRLSLRNDNTEVRKVLSQILDIIHRQPQVGSVEINKDLETILVCAVRYAIGRKSYMPSLVMDYITPLLPYLSDNTLETMAKDIADEDYLGGLGDKMIDRPYWIDFLQRIEIEMEGRNEP